MDIEEDNDDGGDEGLTCGHEDSDGDARNSSDDVDDDNAKNSARNFTWTMQVAICCMMKP